LNRLRELAWYRKNVRWIHSETYCKWTLEKYYENIQQMYFPQKLIRSE
jgi:hypothetical protein